MDDELFKYKENVPKTNKFCFKKVKASTSQGSTLLQLHESKNREVSLPQTTNCDTSTITLNSSSEANENEDFFDNDLSQQSINNVFQKAEEVAIKYLKFENNDDSLTVFKSAPGSSTEYKEEEASVNFNFSPHDVLPYDDFDAQIFEAQPEEINLNSSQLHESPTATRIDNTAEFQRIYPHTEIMHEVLHIKFGLQSYRPNQEEIINASLSQHDCFVLMPTGGGKSLCYQLPAILTPGVTIVISPLRALISDQVDKLNALDIPSAHLCSDVKKADMDIIFSKLHIREPVLKLLYLTPEKIVASQKVVDLINSLYQRGKLSRFVIDEAHCLSQWGHDFRPDYKQLSILRQRYPKVPIMCLTATATKMVQIDVLKILNLNNVKIFIRSFNRPNIKYQVLPKTAKTVDSEIAQLIKKNFLKKSGIIYCLCRADCDKLAGSLSLMGIKARSYHAGLTDLQREKVQRDWMQDIFHVIVATIAFGMGIDKPDVRFVIHNSVPKSVEAFYQESGRAGRDGETSYSYLFYTYGDVIRLQKIMRLDRNSNKKALEGHFDNVKQMAAFCENKIDCRRYLQLIHLGENFDRKLCVENKATICDNCMNVNQYEMKDVSRESRELALLVKDLSSHENVTMLHVLEIYKGSKLKKIVENGHDKHKFYGKGSNMNKSDIHRILKQLTFDKILNDFCVYNREFPVVYIKIGPKFNTLYEVDFKLYVQKNIKTNVNNEAIDSKNPVPSCSSASTSSTVDNYQTNSLRVNCHEELLEVCQNLAFERNVTMSSIMNLSAIKTMAELLPSTKEAFMKIQHVTVANFEKFGEAFLEITKKYRSQLDKLDSQEVRTTSDAFNDDDDDWNQIRDMLPKKKGVKRKLPFRNKKRRTTKRRKGAKFKKGSKPAMHIK